MSKEKTVALLMVACTLIGTGIEYVVHVQSPLSGVLVGILGFIVSMFVCMYRWEQQDRAARAPQRRTAAAPVSLKKPADARPIFAHVPGPGEPGYDPDYDPDDDKYWRRYYRD